MSTPKVTSGSRDSENREECQTLSNYLTENRSEGHLSEAPSELSIVLELPPGTSNIHFDASQLREFKTSVSWEGGKATLRGKAVRRKSNKQPLDRYKGGEISRQPSVSSELNTYYENQQPDASSVNVKVSSKSGLKGPQQGVSPSTESPGRNSPSASNFIETSLKSICNTLQNPISRNLTQEAQSQIVEIDTQPKIVADGKSDSFVATSKQLNLVEKTPETSKRRSPESNIAHQSSTDLLKENSENHSTGSQVEVTNNSSHSSKKCQVRFDQLSNEFTDVAKKSTTSRHDNESEEETLDLDDVSVTSSRQEAFMRNVEKGRERSVPCLSSVELACVDLTSETNHRQKRRWRVAPTLKPTSDKVVRNLHQHVDRESEMIPRQKAVVTEESSTTSLPIASEMCQAAPETEESIEMTTSRNRNDEVQRILDPENCVSTGKTQTQEMPQSTKSKNQKKSKKSSMSKDITDDVPQKDHNTKRFRKALYKCFKSCGHNFNRALAETLQRTVLENRHHLKDLEKTIARDLGLDSEPPSRSVSMISHAFTYEIDSNTSCYTRGSLPTSGETTDNDVLPDDSEMYRLVNADNKHRKKKSALYSETQSSAFVPEDQIDGAGPSTAAPPVTTDGDGARVRRMDIDRGVRIGNTSMNYFVPWDADDFVLEEHIYNSTGIGVQERGLKTPDSQRSARSKKTHHRRRRVSPGVEGKDADTGTVSETLSATDSVKSYGGVACVKESVIQEEFINRDSSLIDESRSGEIEDSFDSLLQSQSFEMEQKSSSKSLAKVSKSSTALLTLYSKDNIPMKAKQSSTDTYFEDQSVTVLYANNRETSANESSVFLTEHSFDATKTPSDKAIVAPVPCPDPCASDETNVKKKRVRLTKRALRSMEKHDEDSTDSEECFTIDKFDGSSSTIVLRKKRKVSSVGLAFLKLRRTLPCRNLPRLMFDQESKESLYMTDTSERNVIKDISLEDVKDYSERSRKHNSSKAKLFNAKWVKSADNLIDFAYIAPKITRLGVDEETFLKKGAELEKKLQKNPTVVASKAEVDKKQVAVVTSNKSVGKRASAVARYRSQNSVRKSKLETFRTLRRQKYNVVKVDPSTTFPSVDSKTSQYSCDRYMIPNVVSAFSVNSYSKEICENLKKPTGTSANEGMDNKQAEESRDKGKASLQIACIRPKTSEYDKLPRIERTCNQNTARTAFIRKQLLEREAVCPSDSFAKKIESTKKAIIKQEENENLKRSRECFGTKKEMSARNSRTVEANIIIGCSSGRGTVAEPSGTKVAGVAGNLIEFARKMEKGNKGNEVVSNDDSNDVDSNRKKVNKNIKKDERKYGNSTSDCVERVSFEDALRSIQAKKDTIGGLSDDDWVTEEETEVSDLESTCSNERKGKVVLNNIKYRDVKNLFDRCVATMMKQANTVNCSEKQNSKTQIEATKKPKSTKNQDVYSIRVKNQPQEAQKSNCHNANSFAATSCSESRGSESKYPTPLCSKRNSKYRSDAGNAVVKTNITPVESAIRYANPSEVVNENLKHVDSIKSSRSPANIFKSVKKQLKVVEYRNAVPATPITDDTQSGPESANTKEAIIRKKMDARRRAAEYDKNWRMKMLRESQVPKTASGSTRQEKLASPERVGYLNTGQVIQTTR